MASFTDLPPELRNAIYAPLLTSPSPTLSLLRVSRQMHLETASFFYQHNAFTIDLTGSAHGINTTTTSISLPTSSSSSLPATLPPIPTSCMRFIRDLTLLIQVPSSYSLLTSCTQQLTLLAASGTRLTRLTLRITSPLSTFLARRVDDAVLDAQHPLTRAVRRLCSVAGGARVEMRGVWFAPGVVGMLRDGGGGRVEVGGFDAGAGVASAAASTYTSTYASTSASTSAAVERGLLGVRMCTHLVEFGLDFEEVEYEEEEARNIFPSPSTHSALSELDYFSPSDFLIADDRADEMEGGEVKGEEKEDDSTSEENLTEADDIDDEEILDIDDLDAILGNMEDVALCTAVERDVCYLTNFAPGVLGGW